MAVLMKSVPMAVWAASPSITGWVDTRYLNDANAHAYVVPAGANYGILVGDGAFYASVSGTAAVPTNDESSGADPWYIPSGVQIRIDRGETISLIRAGASTVIVSIAVYK